MAKLTVLFNHPKDPAAFEKYYAETHMPLAYKIPHVIRGELTKFSHAPGGSVPMYYRMTELHFASDADMNEAMSSPEGQAAAGDLDKFADGGYFFLLGASQVLERAARTTK